MTDAFYMLMLMANLGRDYRVWDKAANIPYRKPGKGTVGAECCLTEAPLDDIREKLKTLPKCAPMFPVEAKDEAGVVFAEVEKLRAQKAGCRTEPAAQRRNNLTDGQPRACRRCVSHGEARRW
jgi:hypothetical protein